ncbi:MAG: hypothetical protein WAQ98_29775 [Blastocatellia bacterium]
MSKAKRHKKIKRSKAIKLMEEIAKNLSQREALAFAQLDEKVPMDRSALKLISMLKAIDDAYNISVPKGEEVKAQYLPEIRKIGEEAHSNFGDDYMFTLGEKVNSASEYGALLNLFWDKIGKWRA